MPNEELEKQRSEHIADLIYPLNTILDDSLGCALWFASRAETANYVSPVRVSGSFCNNVTLSTVVNISPSQGSDVFPFFF